LGDKVGGIKKFDIVGYQSKARLLRQEILKVINSAGSGHPGGSLSCVEILISLYYYKMRHRPEEPSWFARDRFIMSKGHACPALYTILADCGYFPRKELMRFRKLGSMLQGHAYRGVPGVELSTGSLGQGLAVSVGIAIGSRLSKTNFNIYTLLGDGEIQEGQVWEAAMSAAHHKTHNLCAILDCNGVQENGPTSEIMNEEPILDKFRSFGWHVIEINGHDFEEIIRAFDEFEKINDAPTFIKANTIKGKGVSFMEGQSKWHGKPPGDEELHKALEELGV
jgi:transketolase